MSYYMLEIKLSYLILSYKSLYNSVPTSDSNMTEVLYAYMTTC